MKKNHQLLFSIPSAPEQAFFIIDFTNNRAHTSYRPYDRGTKDKFTRVLRELHENLVTSQGA
jgi:hypothetical protein